MAEESRIRRVLDESICELRLTQSLRRQITFHGPMIDVAPGRFPARVVRPSASRGNGLRRFN